MQQHARTDHPLQRPQEVIWLLLVILTPLFVNLWVEQQFEASKVWLLRTVVWVLVLVWLGGLLTGVRTKPLPPSIRTLVILLAGVIVLSTLLSPNQLVALFGSLERANGALTQLSYLVLFLCVATRIDPERSRRLLIVMTWTAVPVCLLGLAQAAGWQPFPVSTDARSLLITTLGRANFTGAYLALLLPLTLVAATSTTGRWQRIGYGVLAGLQVVVIALTQARAAWIAAVVGVGVLVWLHYAPSWLNRVRRLSLVGVVAALAGVLLVALQSGIAAGGSIAARWTIWQASARLLWPRMWLGYGADSLELHFPSVYPPQLVYYQGRGVVVDRAHNWLLDWTLNYGIVATLLFAVLVAIVLWAGWNRLTTPPNAVASRYGTGPLACRWVAASMAGICAQLIGNLFLFDVAATAVVFWLLLAIVTAATAETTVESVSLSLPRWASHLVMVTAVCLAAWAVWQTSVRPFMADLYSWRGTQALNEGNPLAALEAYEVATGHQPYRAGYHVALALTAAQLNNFEQAESAMAQAIALRPGDPVLYTHLAQIYVREAVATGGGAEPAYEAYEQAIALAPTIALTHQQYADLALRLGEGDRALQQAQRAVALDATDGVSFGILGWVLLQAGDLPAARSAFEQAVRWQPDSADFYLGLATAAFEQGDSDSAREAVERSLSLDPAYAPALTLHLQLEGK